MVSDCSPDRALTERILEVADEAGYRAALIDDTDGSVTAWPWFARTVRAAAAGLARRGLAEGDTAGVFVQDAASSAIAVNAIRAAGGRACLIRSDAGPADVADQLNACAARVLTDSGEPGSAGDLTHRDVVVAGPPCGDGPAYTSLLDLTLLAGATLVAAPVPLVAPALRVYKGTAAIVPPGTSVPGLELARMFAAG